MLKTYRNTVKPNRRTPVQAQMNHKMKWNKVSIASPL